MIIEPFLTADIAPFLKLAAAENWVAEPWEFEFLLSEFSRGCWAARSDNGDSAGFVTSLRHGNSGWIGNLIVAENFRGNGIGDALFKKAMEALQLAGVATIWLTASKSGTPLYAKYGFTCIDTIIRWVGAGCKWHSSSSGVVAQDSLSDRSYDLDARVWGDRRVTLLETTAGRGTLLQDEAGLIVLQPCGDALQVGPFTAADESNAERLFDEAAATVAGETKIIVDASAANRSTTRLFKRKKMRIAGSNSLMYAGSKPDYQPEFLYGLATMGSCG